MRSWAEEAGLTIYEFEDQVIKKDTSFDIKLDDRVRDF
jgi:cytidylate kinase